MADRHNPKLRFGMSLREAEDLSFQPSLANGPPLPAVNYGLVGKKAPNLLTTPGKLPKASTVVITWARPNGRRFSTCSAPAAPTMPYSERSRGTWTGWEKYSANLPSGGPSDWTYWGYYRTVEINGKTVLLFKSNTHLDWPGADIPDRADQAAWPPKCSLASSFPSARPAERSRRTMSARSGRSAPERCSKAESRRRAGRNTRTDGPRTARPWRTPSSSSFCFPCRRSRATFKRCARNSTSNTRPTTRWRNSIRTDLNLGDPVPQIDNQTGGGASLLTASTFVVGTTAGTYQNLYVDRDG